MPIGPTGQRPMFQLPSGRLWVCRSIFTRGIVGRFCELRNHSELTQTPYGDALERLHRLWFFDLLAALLAGAPFIVIPEIEHRLAEVLNDVGAVEMDVFH
jgi:hypothetical protein